MAPLPASVALEPQREEEPQFVTLQAMEGINLEDFGPPPPPSPSDTVPKQEADTEVKGNWTYIPRTDGDTSDEKEPHEGRQEEAPFNYLPTWRGS
ncbi:hypothetical protein Pcinc_009253 [Petrolisthes cinctipes]|nr:hypothetical protein Pcinc_009253 [Petrolisthes cinctipes]